MTKYSRKAANKIEQTRQKRKRGTLKSGSSGKNVSSLKQALAIRLLAQAHRASAKIARKSSHKSKTRTLDTALGRSQAKARAARKSREIKPRVAWRSWEAESGISNRDFPDAIYQDNARHD